MQTKFEIKQKVFVLDNNEVQEMYVVRILLSGTSETYDLHPDVNALSSKISREKKYVFATKEELLKSL